MEPIAFEPYSIYRGDCLEILKHFPDECVDLIYIDPPFNSNRNYEIFWGDVAKVIWLSRRGVTICLNT